MLTPLGRQIRKLRIDKGESLKSMAEALSVKSSFLSAIENGRKPLPEKLLPEINRFFSGYGVSLDQWRALAEQSKTRVTMDLVAVDEFDRETCLAFGRHYLQLDLEQKKKIREVLNAHEALPTGWIPRKP